MTEKNDIELFKQALNEGIEQHFDGIVAPATEKTIPELCEDYANVCNRLLKQPQNELLKVQKRQIEEEIAIWRMETLFWKQDETGEWKYIYPKKGKRPSK